MIMCSAMILRPHPVMQLMMITNDGYGNDSNNCCNFLSGRH